MNHAPVAAEKNISIVMDKNNRPDILLIIRLVREMARARIWAEISMNKVFAAYLSSPDKPFNNSQINYFFLLLSRFPLLMI